MTEWLWVWVSVLALVCFFIGWLRGKRKVRKELQPLLKEQQASNEEALFLMAEMKEKLQRAEERSKKAAQEAKTHREMNEEFERQRQQAWTRYHAAGIAAGNAQAMLLRQLEEAVRQLNVYRKADGKEPIEVNTALKGVVDEFKREHAEAS